MDGFQCFIAPSLFVIGMFLTVMPLIFVLSVVDGLVHPEKAE
jgi:hypothetical protein